MRTGSIRQWFALLAFCISAGAMAADVVGVAPQGEVLERPGQMSGTDGPRARLAWPWAHTIAEDQSFVLRFDTAVQDASLLSHTYCEVQGLGEAVPVRLITGVDRERLLDALGWADDGPERTDARIVQCKRLLPPGARVRLVLQPGVSAVLAEGGVPMVSAVGLQDTFQVREPFRATLGCTRATARAPCLPLSALNVWFSSPIARAQAERIILQTPDGPRQASEFAPGAFPGDTWLEHVRFEPPFPEGSHLLLEFPEGLSDDMGRGLENADRFPMDIVMDALPPLVKFASGPFGIVERFAEGPPAQMQTPMVPVALRRAGPGLSALDLQVSAGTVRDFTVRDEVRALQWLARVQGLQEGQLTSAQLADRLALRPMREAATDEPLVDVRSLSILDGATDEPRAVHLPALSDDDGPDIEMLGIPVAEAGLHVIEIASPRLGKALLAEPQAADGQTAAPLMYVRSAVLVTNLSVHLKTGRDDTLIWVTTLDEGLPVPDAQVSVLSCDGHRLLGGVTDAQGLWHAQTPVPADAWCEGTRLSGVMASARIAEEHPMAHGQADFSFTWSTWDRGIEPWRFDIPFSHQVTPDLVAHAVLDRSLVRTGDTVSMKLFVREQTRSGLRSPLHRRLPDTVTIRHVGSGEATSLPVAWQMNAGGGVYAVLDYPLAESARPGQYAIELSPAMPLDMGAAGWQPDLEAGHFRVESFKLPLLQGSLKVWADGADQTLLVAPDALQVDLQLEWISGGPARELAATLSAVAQARTPEPAGDSGYVFGDQGFALDTPGQGQGRFRHLFLDKQPVQLDAQGFARIDVGAVPATAEPMSWLFEASFIDPAGEVQTIANRVDVWPADVIVGIRADRWLPRGHETPVRLQVLGADGQPRAGVPVQLDGRLRTRYSTRKRLVGGFYTYDTQVQDSALGTLCTGLSDIQGEFECAISAEHEGEVELQASARDSKGRVARAAVTQWVWGDGFWSGGGDHDRMDVIPARKTWRAGEMAEFVVHMPFRQARALVAVEREGVLQAQVVELDGDAPVIRLPVDAAWGPNVYVSVLAVRGRVRSVPWASLVQWGWRDPMAWWHARDQQVADAPRPTGLVDLARPAFRYGIAGIQVLSGADQLDVQVQPERASYSVRDTARVRIQARRADGSPAAGAGLAFVAVDEALLELQDNASWDVLDAMRMQRAHGVQTATGQSEVVGRRHYGRKAVAAGGGGGFNATRELFDTRLLWQGERVLDGQGEAWVDVPLNDALSRFRLVAVVDLGADQFGIGQADITTTQDLQLVSGLPQVVREQDQIQAGITVLNRTRSSMALTVRASVEGDDGQAGAEFDAQRITLPAGASQQLSWAWQAPWLPGQAERALLRWQFTAETGADSAVSAQDAILVTQELLAAVPVTVQQASLLALQPDRPVSLPVAAPTGALVVNGHLRGGLQIGLQSSLAGALPGVRDWLRRYPYTCFEQLGSRALGIQDTAAWQALMQRLPSFQDERGLLAYFPGGRGSVALTAYVLEVAARARLLGWTYELPLTARERMLAGLQDFVFGRLEDQAWAPANDAFWRRLIAVEALSLWQAWQPGMLDTFDLVIDDWPTAALVTWLSILQHVPQLDRRDQRLTAVQAILRARLRRHGGTLQVADESANAGWWLMSDVTTVQARLLWNTLDLPGWRADWPLLLQGLLAWQRNGAWATTPANALGLLAVNRFAQLAETRPGQGRVRLALGGSSDQVFDWSDLPWEDGAYRDTLWLPWPAGGQGHLSMLQQSPGSGWANVLALAAVPHADPVDAGLRLERHVEVVSQAVEGHWSVGDIYRVVLTLHSSDWRGWTAVSDPIPAGASILGGGLGRDSAIGSGAAAGSADSDVIEPAWTERAPDAWRAYFDVLPPGTRVLRYVVRLNVPGVYHLPASRAEALYQPDVSGSVPNQPFRVEPMP
ncbi:alpha-2-macroglobulin [Castellaniella sp.]|uniref:alpha-2-macroglobulin family protein n=1 Tax=Castellaniella sp. TaxID=1955812 RepID=UPI0035602B3A